MSKIRSSTSKSSSSSSARGLSGKGAAKVGGGGKAGKSARVKSGLGKVSGGKSMKSSGSKSTKGKTGHKSQKAGEMQNPFKQLGNFLGNVLGTGGGTGSVKGSSGKKSGGSHKAGKSSSAGKSRGTAKSSSAGKSRGTAKSNSAAKNHGAGKTHSTGKSQKTGGTPTGNKTGDKDSVKKSPSETGQKTSPEQVKGQEKTTTGQDGKVMGTAKGTGYYPSNSKMEGGFKDKKGNKLTTLQDVLDGKAKSAAIALDKNLYKSGQVKYGDSFTIPEIDKKYGKHIDFRAVDTGGAFTDKGFSRVDVCTRSKKDSLDPTVNGKLTLMKNPDAAQGQGQKPGAQAEVKAAEQSKKPDTGQLPPGAKVEPAKDTGGAAQQPGKIPGDTLGTTPPRGRAAIDKMFGPAGKNQVNMKMPAGPNGKMINVTCNSKIAPKLNAVYQEIKDKGLSGDIKGYDGLL